MKGDLISKLSEIRSQYNCFDEAEEPYYRALSEAIKMLSEQVDGDTISRQAAIDAITTEGTRLERNGTVAMVEIKQWCVDLLEALSLAQPEILTCEDCKYAGDKPISDERYWCNIHGCFMYYCSDAERREE